MKNYAQWGNYAQWTGAGLTALAITVALFKESIIRCLRHPELTARLEARYPDCVKTPVSHEMWHGSRYFLRLWIENAGDVRADDVEVFVARAWVEGKRGSFEELPQFTPMNLRWSYQLADFKVTTDEHLDQLITELKQFCVEFLVLDVFRALHDWEKNDNTEIQQGLQRINRIQNECECAVALVHHINKVSFENIFQRPSQRLRDKLEEVGYYSRKAKTLRARLG
jgi:hypothetical protein